LGTAKRHGLTATAKSLVKAYRVRPQFSGPWLLGVAVAVPKALGLAVSVPFRRSRSVVSVSKGVDVRSCSSLRPFCGPSGFTVSQIPATLSVLVRHAVVLPASPDAERSAWQYFEAAPRMLAVLATFSHRGFDEMRDETLHGLAYLGASVDGLAQKAAVPAERVPAIPGLQLGEGPQLLEQAGGGVDALPQIASKRRPLRAKPATDGPHEIVQLFLCHSLAKDSQKLRDERDICAREHRVGSRDELVDHRRPSAASAEAALSHEVVALQGGEVPANGVMREAELGPDLLCGQRRPAQQVEDLPARAFRCGRRRGTGRAHELLRGRWDRRWIRWCSENTGGQSRRTFARCVKELNRRKGRGRDFAVS